MPMKNEENKMKKNKKIEYLIWFVIGVILIALLAAGLYLLSGKDKVPKDILVMEIGDEKVYLDEVNLYCLENVTRLGLTADTLDSTTASDGTPSAEYYKNEIFDLILDTKVTYMKAVDEGITLTQQEKNDINNDAVEYIGGLGGSVTKQLGISMDTVIKSYEERYIVKKYGEQAVEDVDVEQQKYCTIYMLLFPKVQVNEDGSYVKASDGESPILLSDDEIKQKKADADEALEELKAGADVEEVAKKYGVELVSGEESNLVGSFGDPFDKYAATLKEGEYSPVLDIASCYAIVKMVEENNQALADQSTEHYREDQKQDELDNIVESLYDEYQIDKDQVLVGRAWDKLSLYDFSGYVEDQE